ncbi:High-affinity glucose transporter RGT2 [Penicillium subrubescens]|uniref:High-affinity glucose transporter RGT2 n=1 Tax=Penicillium subrubescens TaxID=1316194 RepID=A0A1Q5T8I6_9EURO|nr:High-affinity glucose transporter RGT2 [Penicillium subrubescens]
MFDEYIQGKALRRLSRFSCSVGFLIEGYQAGVLGGVQETKPFLNAIGNPTGTETIPMIASSYTLAAAFMSCVVMLIGMPLGRRRCIIIGNAFIAIGGVIQATSYSVPQIIVARVLCRMPIAFQSLFAILSGVSMVFLPDTPRWYYARDNIPEGDKTLSRIYGVYRNGTTNHSTVPEIQAMKQNIMENFHVEEESDNRLTLLSLIWDTTPLRVGRRVRISFLILAIQQSMGINMLVYYMTLIFTNVGLSDFLASLLAAISLTVQWVGSLLCVVTIERIGRRRIMMWTACIETCCMLIFVVLNTLQDKTVSTQWAAAMIMFPYMFFYGWGWVGCPWLYGPEIAPLRYRHIGSAAGLLGVWLFTFLTVFAGGIAFETVGPKIWIWPLIFNAIAFLFVYFMCPDPTNKTLEEVDALFAKDEAILNRLNHLVDEKPTAQEIEKAT